MEYIVITIVVILLTLFIIGMLFLFIKNLNKKNEQTVEKDTPIKKTNELSIELLKLEYEYAKDTSLQAQNDRLTIVNFYLGIYGAFATVALGLNEIINGDIKEFIPLILFFLALVSFIFILKLVRLRQAWLESLKAMDRIKEYFFERDPELENFIIWKLNNLPKAQKFKTLSYLSAILISTLGTGALVGALVLLDLNEIFISLVGLLYFIISISCYHFLLAYGK